MIIRHDLKLVFLHVPKCAGKELRELFSHDARPEHCVSMFNFAYSPVLHRHVDLAHLPMADLVHWPEFRWLESYTTIAAIRNPYERLTSAANEYFRQRSKQDEATINTTGITLDMRRSYFQQLALQHSQLDPRFVHSLPMTWFTHLGSTPVVDHLLRCETLADDVQHLAEQLDLPASIRSEAAQRLRNNPSRQTVEGLSPDEIELAHALYPQDFGTFGYSRQRVPCPPTPNSDLGLELLNPSTTTKSHAIPILSRAERVDWHWGPSSIRQEPSNLPPTRDCH